MSKQAYITVQIPLRVPRVSSSGNTVLFGTLSGEVKTPYGTMRCTANLMGSITDPDTATVIQAVKGIPGLGDPKANKADKVQLAKEARAIVLKSLQDIPASA